MLEVFLDSFDAFAWRVDFDIVSELGNEGFMVGGNWNVGDIENEEDRAYWAALWNAEVKLNKWWFLVMDSEENVSVWDEAVNVPDIDGWKAKID